MKIKLNYLLMLSFGLLLISNCKKDDDDSNGNGLEATCCTDNPHTTVTVNDVNFFIPNIFTPNADGINDTFFLLMDPNNSTFLRIVKMSITKSGEEIFTRNNIEANIPSLGWDGTDSSGQIVSEGVYAYRFEVEFTDNNSTIFEGNLCLSVSREDRIIDCSFCAFGAQHDGSGGFDESLENYETICN